MKFDNNWKYKTLENLEKTIWEKPEFHSNLVLTCHKLRKKQLKDFSIEDLRIMIVQSFSLQYLIPLAIEELEKDILVEGHLYEGDLLKMVLTSDICYWKKQNNNWKVICDLFEINKSKIDGFCHQNNYKNEWDEAFQEFYKINTI